MIYVSIYCLVNPIDCKPFYVGATRIPLKNRLGGHICEYKGYSKKSRSAKMKFIQDLCRRKKPPTATLLMYCSIEEATFYERFFYDLLIGQGYNLLQKSTQFSYKKQYSHSIKKPTTTPNIGMKLVDAESIDIKTMEKKDGVWVVKEKPIEKL